MSEPLKTSVKQLEMAFKCPRKWAYHYLFGIPQIEGQALHDGNELHTQMKCLIEGIKPKHAPESRIGKMARELFSKYVHNKSGRHVTEIVKDVRLPEYGLIVGLRADYLDRPQLKDWKSTGAANENSKLKNGLPWTPKTLEDMFQPNIYSFLLMRDHWAGLEAIDADWCYVSKDFKQGQTPRTWAVPHRFLWEPTKAWFEKYVLPTADLIRTLRSEHAAGRLDMARLVPHNAPSCEHSGLFCDAAGHCRMVSSPVATYSDLHLPVLKG
jgi:hypothetical protein